MPSKKYIYMSRTTEIWQAVKRNPNKVRAFALLDFRKKALQRGGRKEKPLLFESALLLTFSFPNQESVYLFAVGRGNFGEKLCHT